MKRIWLCFGLLACSMLFTACATPWNATGPTVPPCDLTAEQPKLSEGIAQVYQPLGADTCVAQVLPVDQSGWWESNMNSRRVRGEQSIQIGCTNCPPGNIDCTPPNQCGGCGTADLLFDFTQMRENAKIEACYLAVNALENQDLLAQEAVVRGRVNVGSDWAVIASKPIVRGGWLLFDITPFACRNVVERRNAATIEISLPCGKGDARIATAALEEQDLGPTLIFEYR